MFWFALCISVIGLIFGAVISLRSLKGAYLGAFFIVMLWGAAPWGIFIKYRHWLKLTGPFEQKADEQSTASSYLKGALLEFVILNEVVVISMLSWLASR
jgi:hypothetical protein